VKIRELPPMTTNINRKTPIVGIGEAGGGLLTIDTIGNVLSMSTIAKGVFTVLRLSHEAGKHDSDAYIEQHARATMGAVPYPSIYAARDAAYEWLQDNPTQRATIVVLSGHYENVCHEVYPLENADRTFMGDASGVYTTDDFSPAVAPTKTMTDATITEDELTTLDFFGKHAVNPNASSLFVDGMDLICESGTHFTFSGVCAWLNDSKMSNVVQWDSVKFLNANVTFFSNTHTDYSARVMEIAGGYVHNFWSQFSDVKIGKLIYSQSPFDKWGWTGFGYLTTLVAINGAKRGNFKLEVKETMTPDSIACYGLNSPRIINTDVNIQWYMSGKSYLYFPISLGNWSPTRYGFVVRDSNISIATNLKSSRPDFVNNLHYQNIFLFGFPSQAFHSGNRVKIVADTDTENGIFLTQDAHYEIHGQIILRKHLYDGKDNVPYMTVIGGMTAGGSVKVGARIEGEEDVVVFNGKVTVLPSASCNANHKGGLPIVK
jgi:hypothetical protein